MNRTQSRHRKLYDYIDTAATAITRLQPRLRFELELKFQLEVEFEIKPEPCLEVLLRTIMQDVAVLTVK